MKTSDHFDGKHFFNLGDNYEARTFGHVLRWKMTSKPTAWPATVALAKTAKPDTRVEGLRVTMVNHATLLVQQGGVNILTDPVWSDRVSPLSWAGPLRHMQPGVAFADLPPIDVVLLSHDHYDHCDLATLTRVATHNPLVVTGLGMTPVLHKTGLTRIVELDWWQSTQAGAVKIDFTPAQHWSSRSPFDRNTRLWGSFVITSNDKVFYFAADTGMGPHFAMIHERFPRIDIAALPIGAYEPRWFMKPQHMNPDDAVAAHAILAPTQSVGIHWGTFQLTDEGIEEPVETLKRLGAANFVGLRNGEQVEG